MKANNYSKFTDEQLVKLINNGASQCTGILYNRYFKKVYQKCFSFVKNSDDALDLTQDILLRAFEKINTFKERSSFSTWLYSITHNYCISYTSKLNRYAKEDIDEIHNIADMSSNTEDTDRFAEHEIKINEMVKLLLDLPFQERDMLEKKYRHNYSVLDLQKEFNLSASSVKMRLMRARQKMEKKLAGVAA